MNMTNIIAYRELSDAYATAAEGSTDARILYDLKESAWDNAYIDNLGESAELPWSELGPHETEIADQVCFELTK